MKPTALSKMKLISSMFVFGTIGIFVKYIPLPSSVIALARGVTGTLFLVIALLLSKRKINFSFNSKDIILLFVSGGFIGFNWIFLFEAYRYTTVAVATLCYYFAPALVIIASPLVFKERLSVKKAVCVMLSLLGMAFISGVFSSTLPALNELTGVFFGLMAAVLYASVMIINKKLCAIPAYEKTIMQLGMSAIVVLPYTLLTGGFVDAYFSVPTVILLAVVGIVHTGITYFLYFGSMDNLKPHTIALLSYIDPLVAVLLSAIVLGENFGVHEFVGMLLIIGSSIISELPDRTA